MLPIVGDFIWLLGLVVDLGLFGSGPLPPKYSCSRLEVRRSPGVVTGIVKGDCIVSANGGDAIFDELPVPTVLRVERDKLLLDFAFELGSRLVVGGVPGVGDRPNCSMFGLMARIRSISVRGDLKSVAGSDCRLCVLPLCCAFVLLPPSPRRPRFGDAVRGDELPYICQARLSWASL